MSSRFAGFQATAPRVAAPVGTTRAEPVAVLQDAVAAARCSKAVPGAPARGCACPELAEGAAAGGWGSALTESAPGGSQAVDAST